MLTIYSSAYMTDCLLKTYFYRILENFYYIAVIGEVPQIPPDLDLAPKVAIRHYVLVE